MCMTILQTWQMILQTWQMILQTWQYCKCVANMTDDIASQCRQVLQASYGLQKTWARVLTEHKHSGVIAVDDPGWMLGGCILHIHGPEIDWYMYEVSAQNWCMGLLPITIPRSNIVLDLKWQNLYFWKEWILINKMYKIVNFLYKKWKIQAGAE